MKPIDSTLVHRIAPPEVPLAEPYPTLFLLHGLGADEEDLVGLSSFLDDRFLLISVRAPFAYTYSGYTWYQMDGLGTPEPISFDESYSRLSTFLDDALRAYPIDPKRMFLFGFSMGTVMSLSMALTRPELFRGVVANSGYLAEGTHLTYRWNALSHLDFFIAHGTSDPVVPIAYGRHVQEMFKHSNARFVYREYPMGHQISEESLDDIVEWMGPLL